MLRNVFRRLTLMRRKVSTAEYLAALLPNGVLAECGARTYGRPVIRRYQDGGTLSIGDYCSIATGVTLMLGGRHNLEAPSTYPFRRRWKRPGVNWHIEATKLSGGITIGSDVWMGVDALVLAGVSIGHGAIIGARSVVTKDVPPYAVVAGNPARLIRYRFLPEQIAAMLEIAWWAWSEDKLALYVDVLASGNAAEFISRVRVSPDTHLS